MKCAFISDLHIKSSYDDATDLFMKFCKNSNVQSCQKIILLGDIFDLMIGDHFNYTKKFPFFFEEITKFLDSGKEVIFIEGNHDFHFEQTCRKYFKKNSNNSEKFRYLKSGENIVLNDKVYFYCHGYEVDYFNKYFKRWYKVYSSIWFKILTTYILNFYLIQKLGEWASKDSKKRGKKTFDYGKMKEKYLVGAKALLEEVKVDGIISGHTHIPEFHTYEDGKIYLNPGFPTRDRYFIYFDGKVFSKEFLR